MRFTSLSVIAALSTLALSQNLADLPTCAQGCVGTSFGNCNPIDIKCVCSQSDLISSLSCCVSQSCGAPDQEKTIKFAADLCGAEGVQIPTSAACSSGASASSTPPPSSGSSSATAAGSSSGTTAGTASGSATPNSNAASATAQTTNAAPIHTGIVGMGMAMAGLLVAL